MSRATGVPAVAVPPELADERVNQLLRLAPRLVADAYPDRRTCVLSTRVAVEVLAYFGIRARPWPCRLVVMNAIAAAYRKGRPPAETFPDGGFTLGQMGTGAVRHGADAHGERFIWDGHLVAMLDGYGKEGGVVGSALLLDLCLGDYARPEYDIVASPMRCLAPQEEIDAGQRLHAPLPKDGLVLYESIDSGAWRTAPDWSERHRWYPLAAELIRALRDADRPLVR